MLTLDPDDSEARSRAGPHPVDDRRAPRSRRAEPTRTASSAIRPKPRPVELRLSCAAPLTLCRHLDYIPEFPGSRRFAIRGGGSRGPIPERFLFDFERSRGGNRRQRATSLASPKCSQHRIGPSHDLRAPAGRLAQRISRRSHQPRRRQKHQPPPGPGRPRGQGQRHVVDSARPLEEVADVTQPVDLRLLDRPRPRGLGRAAALVRTSWPGPSCGSFPT